MPPGGGGSTIASEVPQTFIEMLIGAANSLRAGTSIELPVTFNGAEIGP